MQLSADEQAALDEEVTRMQEEQAQVIEVKAHKREVRKPVLSSDLPTEETHIYPDGVKDKSYGQTGRADRPRLRKL